MKKKLITLAAVILLTCSLSSTSSAGTFGTAGTLRPGHFSLGLEPTFTFSPSTFMFFFHGGFGLTRAIDLDVKLGLGSTTYFGADLEFVIARDSKRGPGLSFTAGAHGAGNFGLDATLLLSNRFSTFSLYGALDADIEFIEVSSGTELVTPVYFDIGVSIPMSRNISFLLEGDIAITNSATSGLSGGLAFFF